MKQKAELHSSMVDFGHIPQKSKWGGRLNNTQVESGTVKECA
jgi:hypothetical protein